jgi:probable poly-beta-1,6-N-acetyl-D-glucosamine export protein
MFRRLAPLNGLAIIAVVANHAGAWGYTAMFWWVDRYRPLQAPNFDQVGSLTYFMLLVIRRLTLFSVPVFLVTSGIFVAYVVQGGAKSLNRNVLMVRLSDLLIPYVIWSILAFIGDALMGYTHPFMVYLERLAVGQARGPYFYVILMVQLYILAPFVTNLAVAHWKPLLIVAAAMHVAIQGLDYANLVAKAAFATEPKIFTVPTWLFARLFIFFVLGVVIGTHSLAFQAWLKRQRSLVVAGLAICIGLTLLEGEFIFRLTKETSAGISLVSSIYALSFILWWLSREVRPSPLSQGLLALGAKSYGIYLMHYLVLEVVSKGLYHFVPEVLGIQVLFQVLLISAGVLLPVVMMAVVKRSPLRKSYSLMFG